MHLNWNALWQHAGDPVRGGDDAKSPIEQGKAQPNAPYARLAEMVTRARYRDGFNTPLMLVRVQHLAPVLREQMSRLK